MLTVSVLLATALAGTPPLDSPTVPDVAAAATEDGKVGAPSPQDWIGYDKGAYLRSPDRAFGLKANGRVQGRYTLDSLDDGAAASELSIPRARLKLSGHAFGPTLGFELQVDVAKGYLSLKDAALSYEVLPGWLTLRAGQFKRPFALQQLTSSGKLALVDRAITDDYFGAGRDIGVEVSGGPEDGGLSYAFGLFNGSGAYKRFFGLLDESFDPAVDAGPLAVPFLATPMAAGRVAWSFGDVKMYDEVDRDGGPLRAAIGASGFVRTDPYTGEQGRSAISLDGVVKAHGFTGMAAMFASAFGGALGASPEAIGAQLQASYLVGERLLPVVAAAAVLPLTADELPLYEARGGLALLLNGHDAKLTVDVGALGEGTARPDLQARTQVQLAF